MEYNPLPASNLIIAFPFRTIVMILFRMNSARNKEFIHSCLGAVIGVWKVSLLILAVVIAATDLRAQPEQSAESYLNSAVRHLQNRELAEALSDLNKAVELNPQYAMAFLLRGNLRESNKEIEGALSDYNRAIEIAPDAHGMEVGYNNRSIIRLMKGDITGALADINHAIKLNPRHAAFYNQRAIVRLQQGESNDYVADYEKALELNPKLPSAYYGRGGYRFRQGDLEGAAADYDKAIEFMPGYADAYVCRGVARGLNGDLEGALGDIKRGAALNANAVSDQSRGKFTTPFKDLSQLIKSDPANGRAYEFRAILWLIQGKAKEAEQDFHKSLELNPKLKAEIDRIVKEIRWTSLKE